MQQDYTVTIQAGSQQKTTLVAFPTSDSALATKQSRVPVHIGTGCMCLQELFAFIKIIAINTILPCCKVDHFGLYVQFHATHTKGRGLTS